MVQTVWSSRRHVYMRSSILQLLNDPILDPIPGAVHMENISSTLSSPTLSLENFRDMHLKLESSSQLQLWTWYLTWIMKLEVTHCKTRTMYTTHKVYLNFSTTLMLFQSCYCLIILCSCLIGMMFKWGYSERVVGCHLPVEVKVDGVVGYSYGLVSRPFVHVVISDTGCSQ